MTSDRDDAYRREYEALRNSRRALERRALERRDARWREAGQGPAVLVAVVTFVVAAVLLGAWWIA